MGTISTPSIRTPPPLPPLPLQTEELHRRAYNGAFEAFGLEVGGEPVVWDVTYYDKLQNTVSGTHRYIRTAAAHANQPRRLHLLRSSAHASPAPAAGERGGRWAAASPK